MTRKYSASGIVTISNEDAVHQESVCETLRIWQARWADRARFANELVYLPDETLKDFGLTRSIAQDLSHRPFWRA